jgi:hypothetical protein
MSENSTLRALVLLLGRRSDYDATPREAEMQKTPACTERDLERVQADGGFSI